ncbi:cAMP-dependent protein kinase catalytic subunit alpha-like [Daktulosphaira vitifoliae]|uniref:cAMP-dependent protein kinase catalytic subunit alpha-like n=1 Tax=Daktulosphaira vitifoliae TaxID=58002 RepID=UPI0021AA7951|nr:cAMP-dependent protein kinase catalytic subunit alpha-like [Daktulosphaira vitifoliae]
MGCVLSKSSTHEWEPNEGNLNQKSSCGLTSYWNLLKSDFENKYFNENKASIANHTDFRMYQLLGEGAYGLVALTTHTRTGEVYATKIMAKKKIIKKELVQRTFNEKRILESIDFAFVVRLTYFYQDNTYLYFVMPFVCGGDLFTYIQRKGRLDEDKARFYGSEVLLAIEYLHRLNLVHRDVKPENILIDSYGHAQLADFGFCKYVQGRTYTLCGTPEYIAPEMLVRKGYGRTVDYWAFGVLIYEMVAGYSPFVERDEEIMYRRISTGKYTCPFGFTSDLMDILRHVLVVDVTKRYGNLVNGVRDIKKHRWFESIDWCATFNKQTQPPFVPVLLNSMDSSNFNKFKEKIFVASSKDQYNDEFKHF